MDRGFLVLADNSLNKCAGASMEFIENGNLTATKKTILNQPIEDYVPLVIATLSGFLFIIVVTLVIFVFRQEMRVLVPLAVRHPTLLPRQHRCDKAERDKLFDAFISYSSKDEAFVSEELAPLLEHGDPSYKLCLHYRDFRSGPT